MSKKSWHFWKSTIWHKSRRICTVTLRTVTSWSSAMWFRYGNTAHSNSSSYKSGEYTINYRSLPPGQNTEKRIVQFKSGWFRSQRSRHAWVRIWTAWYRVQLFSSSFPHNNKYQFKWRSVSSVGRAPVGCAGGWGFKPQTGPIIRIFK